MIRELGAGPSTAGGRHLGDLVLEWERAAGTEAAVYLADDVRGLARISGRVAELLSATETLQWLTRVAVTDHYARPLLLLRGGDFPELVDHLGVDYSTGKISLRDYEDPETRLPPTTQPLLAGAVIAAVYPRAVAPTDYGQEKPRAPVEPMPWNIYDSRILRYSAPPGTPIEVTWRLIFDMHLVPWMCLINAANQEDLPRIPYRQMVPATDFVDALRQLLGAASGKGVSLGLRTGTAGHFVTAVSAYDGLVEYIDPWGGRSLLCEENNSLGIRAARVDERRGRWTITEAELARAAHVALVLPAHWAELVGQAQHVVLNEGLAALGVGALPPSAAAEPFREGTTLRWLELGREPGELTLVCVTDASESVILARLQVSPRLHAESERGLLDVANFLEAFTPPGDLAEVHPLAQTLAVCGTARLAVGNPAQQVAVAAQLLGDGPLHLRDLLLRAAAVLLAEESGAFVPFFLSHLIIERGAGANDPVVVDIVTGMARFDLDKWLPPLAA